LQLLEGQFMRYENSVALIAIAAALAVALSSAQAFDETKYPNWKGQWQGIAAGENAPWDPAKPAGAGQQAPLTAEYQAVFEAGVKNAASGGAPPDPTMRCSPAGMPRIMMAVRPMEIVITPRETDFLLEQFSTTRRVYTDGRKFPDEFEPRFTGYSVGEWQDTDRDGRFDTLVIETHGIKGPHTYDASGIPFHKDGEAIVKERLYTDKTDPNVLHNDITTIDHALTQPWTVTRSYRRSPQQRHPDWSEFTCSGDPTHVLIGTEYYALSPDGLLMPVRQGQKPPDLRYFK
jgi:hypothetical protein